jgi:hypothetical protein
MDPHFFRKQSQADLATVLFSIVEAWDAPAKEQIVRTFGEQGWSLVEHAVYGEYDLTLWRRTEPGSLYGCFAVALNNAQHNPIDAITQITPVPAARGPLPIHRVLSKLQEWVNGRGRLLIASISQEKLNAYRRILSQQFTIENYDPEQPSQLFWISAAR